MRVRRIFLRSDHMHKTIFGTTEKSNFILNMKSSTLYNWIAFILILCIAVPQIGNFFALSFSTNTAIPAIFLYITGFMSILFFIITALKSEFSFKENKIFFLIVAIAVWAFASYYGVVISANSDFYIASFAQELINTAIMGELGRNEGLLAVFAYCGIFILALTVNSDKTVVMLLDVMVGFGVAQSLIAIMQHIPGLKFLTLFDNLPTLALDKVMLSSGLTGSPLFYGSYIAIIMAIAFAGAVFSKNILRARLYGAAALLLWLTGLFTSSIVPIVSGVCILLVMTVVVLIQKKKGGISFEGGIVKSALARYGIMTGGMAVIFLAVFFLQGIYIRDKAIAFYDAYFNLFIVNSYHPKEERSLYEIGFDKGLAYIKENPIFGVGPDCIAKMESIDPEIISPIDRIYNEFIHTAATKGIPSLAAYAVLIIWVLKNAVTKTGEFFTDAEKWYRTALAAAIITYFVQSMINTSAITVAPLFWLVCGLACAKGLDAVKKSK